MNRKLRAYTRRNLKTSKLERFFSGLSVTGWFILINILVFIILLPIILTYPDSIKYIALQPLNILQLNYFWTLITSMFMHGGFFHLFANMISLFFLGTFIERLIGKKRFFWFYMISGLVSGLFFVFLAFVFQSDLNAFAVGASGAIFALAGLLMILTPNLKVYIMAIIPMKMKYAAVFLLLALWAISLSSSIGIGNTAHLGGLIVGVVYGVYLRKKYKEKADKISKMFS